MFTCQQASRGRSIPSDEFALVDDTDNTLNDELEEDELEEDELDGKIEP